MVFYGSNVRDLMAYSVFPTLHSIHVVQMLAPVTNVSNIMHQGVASSLKGCNYSMYNRRKDKVDDYIMQTLNFIERHREIGRLVDA